MEYKGIPVLDLYQVWTEQQELKKKKEEAGKLWDKTYREKHREERNLKAREYYKKRKARIEINIKEEVSDQEQKDA